MLRALLDANLMVRKAESAERPQRTVSNILPIVLPSREQHRLMPPKHAGIVVRVQNTGGNHLQVAELSFAIEKCHEEASS